MLLPKRQKRITFRWLILLHILILSTVLSYAFFVAKITVNPQEFKSAINGGIIYGSAIFLGLIVLCLLLFPDILYGFPKQQLEGSLKSKSSKVKYIKRGFVKNKEQEKEQAYYRELEQEI